MLVYQRVSHTLVGIQVDPVASVFEGPLCFQMNMVSTKKSSQGPQDHRTTGTITEIRTRSPHQLLMKIMIHEISCIHLWSFMGCLMMFAICVGYLTFTPSPISSQFLQLSPPSVTTCAWMEFSFHGTFPLLGGPRKQETMVDMRLK